MPPLDGDPVILDMADDFEYYNGTAKTARPMTTGTNEWSSTSMASLQKGPMRSNVDAESARRILAEIDQLVQARPKVDCRGEARIRGVTNQFNQLTHWDVCFKNTGDQPWIGTVVFDGDGADKNAGIGLESMAVPHNKSSAVQRIEVNGNYGVKALQGATVRLGVRAFGYALKQLPGAGQEVVVDVAAMIRDCSGYSDEFFDLKAVEQKRNEKVERVQFFENGKAINGELKPIVLSGVEARARATFDAPRFQIVPIEGGWELTVENPLPAQDKDGPMSMVGTVKILTEGEPINLDAKRFVKPGEKKSWRIDRNGAQQDIEAGARILIGTRGCGWYAIARLPKKKPLEGSAAAACWRFREDQYHRNQLTPEFTSEVKD
jgi:hypothetical protein